MTTEGSWKGEVDAEAGRITAPPSIFASFSPRTLDLEKDVGFVVDDLEQALTAAVLPAQLVASPASTATSRLVIDVGSDAASTDGVSSAGDCRSLARTSEGRRRGARGLAAHCWGGVAGLDKVALFMIVSGCLSLLFGILTTICTPYDVLMRERLKMVPGLPAFEWWATPPDEVLLRVYVFNITNQYDFESGRSDKLRMQEVGPFVFREKLIHTNVSFHDNGTMTYTAVRTAIFLPEMNTLSLDAPLTVPNLAVLGMASYLHDATFFTKLGFNMILRRLASRPLMNITVDQYMWNLTDPLVHVTRAMVPHLVPVDNMGFLHRIYADFTDEVSVFIGPENERRFFQMDRFHGDRNLGWWKGDRCDSVYGGTEGVSYHQGVLKEDELRYFRKTLCRVMPLYYARDEERLGMSAMRFELPDDVYDRAANATTETDCFTRPGQSPLPAGLTDLAPCYFNFPIAASMPHFYSSPHLQTVVEGLQPDRDKHHSYVILEPTTGVPMNAAARSQSNLIVHDVSGINGVERFSNQIIPVFWAEYIQVGLPWYIHGMMYFTVLILPWSQRLCSVLMVVAGAALLVSAARRLGRKRMALRTRRLHHHRAAKAPPLSSYSSLDLLPSSGSSAGEASSSSAASTSGSSTAVETLFAGSEHHAESAVS